MGASSAQELFRKKAEWPMGLKDFSSLCLWSWGWG